MGKTNSTLLAAAVVMLVVSGPLEAAPYCGNGVCEPTETTVSCPDDCCPPQDQCPHCDVTAYDADVDGVPDQLEFDLAYAFFPHIKLQHQVADLDQSYAYLGLPLPFSVQPWTDDGVCTEPFACLELRFGTPYVNDCGDNASSSCDGTGNHPGDSEFYAALVHRGPDWSEAQNDAADWFLLRDFTAAHWGSGAVLGYSAESSRFAGYGMCVQCFLYSGWATGCADDPACTVITPVCVPIENEYSERPYRCYSTVLGASERVLYSSEGKHALYHSDSECDAGGVDVGTGGADECPSNAFDMKDHIAGLLQNVGDLANGRPLGATIPAPELDGTCHDITIDHPFGEATSYNTHFTHTFDWFVPDNPCGAVQSVGDSLYDEPGCAGREHHDTTAGSHLSWDGSGCSATWEVPAVVASRRDADGYCHDEPAQLVTTLAEIERAPLQSCSPCPEAYCESATIEDISYHRTSNCTGYEFYETAGYSSRGSWDGGGCVGSVLADRILGSYRDSDGYCHPVTSLQLGGMVRVYRDTSPPANCTACGEASCSPVTNAGDSFFLGAECGGTEYARPSGSDARQSWTGDGCSGNLLQTVAVTTQRDAEGYCWPASSQQVVRVYRTTEPSLPTCAGCEERSCTAVSSTDFSYFTGSGCGGDEYYDVNVGSATRRSWDGQGCAGDMVQGSVYMRSYRDFNGACHDWTGYVGGVVRVYRDDGGDPPSGGCRGCPDIQDGSGP